MSVRIAFETHSTSEDNERGKATGWLDGQLSKTGREQARELGERRRDETVDAIFTSDLGRAVETAEIAFGGSRIPIHREPRLRECNYGALNGMLVAPLDAERPKRIDKPFPGGESYRQVVDRVDDFLGDLAESWDGKRVVLIGHSATRWALDYLVEETPLEELVIAPFEWRPGWEYLLT